MKPCLLAIDPSITAPGYAVLDLSHDEPRLLAAGVWKTAPVKGASKSEDTRRRVLFIWRELRRVIAQHQPIAIAIEEGAGSKNAQTAAAMARASAVATCAADLHLRDGEPIYISAVAAGTALGITSAQRVVKPHPTAEEKAARKAAADRRKYLNSKRMSELSPDEQIEKRALSRAAAKKRDARKDAIARAVVARLGSDAWCRALECENALDDAFEGAHDAAAVALAAWERPEIAGLRVRARQTSIPGTEAASA